MRGKAIEDEEYRVQPCLFLSASVIEGLILDEKVTERGNEESMTERLLLIFMLVLMTGCMRVVKSPVRLYHFAYCDKMNADGVRCDWWATPCGKLECR
jgi:hypothetical protein